jgi:DNA-binding NarL/FixJ family response regulator
VSKNRKYLLGIALVLSSVAISIRGSNGDVRLVLAKYPVLITILIVLSSFLVALYFRMANNKISNLTTQIKEQAKDNSEGFKAQLNELTPRQREVYELIVLGRTNKEIRSELFIEQSTLKSHINQIYRKLDINSRRELKLKTKP